ncbi:helix-turn-helix domain-containing protein [Nonomuraea sp. NPDC050643]|uniref:helix-turn-helix domain-containing protein n=1 Tax=Nonomuraea sp. NPDC050643 TaxID=3155660 RepID=UPI0033FC77B0
MWCSISTSRAGGGLSPRPKGPRKLTPQVMDRVEQWRAADPRLKGRALARLIEAEFGFPVHPRSVERALRRRREPRDPEAATGR